MNTFIYLSTIFFMMYLHVEDIRYSFGGIIINQTSSLIHAQDQIQKQKGHMFTPHLCIPSRISLIDELIGGFKANTLTYLYGNSSFVHRFPYYLCINTYAMFHGISVFIDGGTSVNPYILSKYAKTYEIPIWDVLGCVQVSRAFTMHQFHSIVHDALEHLIKKQKPKTLIFHAFPLLYMDKDVSFHEASTLFNVTLETIQVLTKKYQLITLITNPVNRRNHGVDTLHQSLFDRCDEIISIQHMKHCPRIWLPQYHSAATITQGSKGQLCLPDFGMVM